MSRIEEAMEKASQLRQGAAAIPAGTIRQAPVQQSVYAPSLQPAVRETITAESPFLVNLNDPASPTAEEYRKLKTVFVKLTRGERFRHTIMVTSAVPHEGKSITSLNLALCLALEGEHDVLLVDADLRRPTINRYFGINHTLGFSDCLNGTTDLRDAIIGTDIDRLTVLTAGSDLANPAELAASHRLQALVEEMKLRFPDSYIIFDTPPVLPFAETRTLAHLADGVLFVVKERLASQENIRDAIDALKGCTLLGMVYNDAVIDQHDHRYSYYRNYAAAKP